MYRDLFTHPYIGSYSVLLLVGYFFGFLLARWRAPQNKIEGRHVDNLVLLLLLITPVGARSFSRLFYFPTKLSLWNALKIWEGGGVVFSGGTTF
ncbi:MAG: prolipoprotein diacylglyceryl transferase family protein [Limisphaerales bacterium]